MKIAQISIVLIGIIIFAAGGWILWSGAHKAHPAPEQIDANMTAISEAVSRHSARGIMKYLDEDFTWSGQDHDEMTNTLNAAMFQTGEMDLKLNSTQTQIHGNTATTTGNYELATRMRNEMEKHTYRGSFQVEWRKSGNDWLIIQASQEGELPQ